MPIIIEKSLSLETKKAGKGSIVHDPWTKFGEHFFGVFATYTTSILELDEGVLTVVKKHVIPLLSVAPLHDLAVETDEEEDDDEEDKEKVEESSTFTADVHYRNICDILTTYYSINIDKWLTNQTADSASVNTELAKLFGIPHVNYENHLLSNEVTLWLKETASAPTNNARYVGPGFVCAQIHESTLSSMRHGPSFASISSGYSPHILHHALSLTRGF